MFSYNAAAVISTGTELFVAIAAFVVVVKKIDYYPRMEKAGGIALAAVGMTLFLFLFSRLNFFFLALTSAAVYFTGLWIFRAVRTEEVTSLITKRGVEEYEYESLP